MVRRAFIKLTGTGAVAALAPRLWAQPRTPNVVLIFIDDMGWKDAGFAGSDFYETPTIDRLAKEGVVFTNAYSCGANCAPSRACLISGQYGPRHGVYAVDSTKRGPVTHMRLEPIPNRGQLDPANVTVAEAMQAAGYATAMFGKWHLGGKGDTSPGAQGFELDGMCASPSAEQLKQTDDPKAIYKITDAACRFMAKNRERPFFAYVSHHATHSPSQSRAATLARFHGKTPGKIHTNPELAAMNAQMDDGVGILLHKLKELDLEANTLVIFASDNGGPPPTSQPPLRGYKGMLYEGGIRVPMIARWPGVTTAGATCDVPVANVDFYPTFLDAAGARAPEGKTLDGESLLPLLKGGVSLKRDALFWHMPGYLNGPNPGSRDPIFRTRPVTVIRKSDWKLHLFHEEWVLDGGREKIDANNAVELYNLREDVSEATNLAPTRKDKRDELLDDLLAWIRNVSAPLPTQRNPQYDASAPPPAPRKGRRQVGAAAEE